MPRTERQARGISFEDRVVGATGGSTQPGSGNGWSRRGDVVAPPFLFSAKATANRTWSETRRQLREAHEMAVGTGHLSALAVLDDDGEELVVVRLCDLVEALSGDVRFEQTETVGDRRHRAAGVPLLLRDA